MISKELVYKYLSENLLEESWFNFKEDDTQSDQNQNDEQSTSNTEKPDLSWHFIKDKMILFNGSSDKPTEQYGIFSDIIRYYKFNNKDKDKDKDKNKDTKVAKDFKTKARNFTTAAVLGGITAVAADAANKAINSTADKNKKDKNGNEDKWKDFAQADFNSIGAFQKHAQDHHVPSSLIDNFINNYNQLKQSPNNTKK